MEGGKAVTPDLREVHPSLLEHPTLLNDPRATASPLRAAARNLLENWLRRQVVLNR